MARFQRYVRAEQAGDHLVLIGEHGQERQIGFRILKLAPQGGLADHFIVWLASGAWVVQDADGGFGHLLLPTATSDLAALTLGLAEPRVHVLVDQLDQARAG